MSIETGATTTEAADDVETLASDLGEAITDLPEYQAFEEAKAAVEADSDLQEQISEFEQLRQEFMLARQTGEASQEDVRKIKQTQQELHSQPAMAEFLDAKSALVDRLAGINDAISEPLAVDFGGEAGGCCHD